MCEKEGQRMNVRVQLGSCGLDTRLGAYRTRLNPVSATEACLGKWLQLPESLYLQRDSILDLLTGLSECSLDPEPGPMSVLWPPSLAFTGSHTVSYHELTAGGLHERLSKHATHTSPSLIQQLSENYYELNCVPPRSPGCSPAPQDLRM